MALRVLLVPVVALLLIASAILVVGQLAPGGDKTKIALTVAWLVVIGMVLGKAVKGRPELRVPMRIATIGAGVLVLAWYGNSLRPRNVDEELIAPAAAAQAARGSFAPLGHDGTGTAELLSMDGRLVLQLRDFETDGGPDLRLYLSTDDDASEFVDLGSLKGTSGNQRYDVPEGTDTAKFSTVLVWCRAFSVPFTSAKLN